MDFYTKLSIMIKKSKSLFDSKKDEDFLGNARQLTEEICDCIILFYYEKLGDLSKGLNILNGKYTHKGTQGRRKPLALDSLINEVVRDTDAIILPDLNTRERIKQQLTEIRLTTNHYNHSSVDYTALPVSDDARLIRLCLARLIVWLFKGFLIREIPSELIGIVSEFAPGHWLVYILRGKPIPFSIEEASNNVRRILELPIPESEKMTALQSIDNCNFEEAKKLFIKSAERNSDETFNDYITAGNLAFLSDTSEALKIFNKAHNIQPNNPKAHLNLAHCYKRLGNYDLSKKHYEMVLSLHTSEDTKLCAMSYAGLSDIAREFGENAITYLEKSLEIARNLDDKLLLAAQYSRHGQLLFQSGKLNDALDKLSHSKLIYEGIDSLDGKAGLAKQYLAIGNVYLKQAMTEKEKKAKLDDAETIYLESFYALDELNNIDGIANAHAALGNCYFIKGDLINSESEFCRALEAFEEIQNNPQKSKLYFQLFTLNFLMSKCKASLKYYWYGLHGFWKISKRQAFFVILLFFPQIIGLLIKKLLHA